MKSDDPFVLQNLFLEIFHLLLKEQWNNWKFL